MKNRWSQPPKSAIMRKTVKNPHATYEERSQGEIELDSLEKENEGMEKKILEQNKQ